MLVAPLLAVRDQRPLAAERFGRRRGKVRRKRTEIATLLHVLTVHALAAQRQGAHRVDIVARALFHRRRNQRLGEKERHADPVQPPKSRLDRRVDHVARPGDRVLLRANAAHRDRHVKPFQIHKDLSHGSSLKSLFHPHRAISARKLSLIKPHADKRSDVRPHQPRICSEEAAAKPTPFPPLLRRSRFRHFTWSG